MSENTGPDDDGYPRAVVPVRHNRFGQLQKTLCHQIVVVSRWGLYEF